jgi:putrescine transport system ATP-binding protein
MLAGFEQPTAGQIVLDGVDLSSVPPYQRPINMMFQSYALFPHMTVEQNIAFGLKQDKLPKAEITARVAEMLSLVHMQEFAKRKPHQLSGGQRQRVALARSLAKRPKLLLLDEPMGALDKKLRDRMQLEVVDILERVGVTCVMVTHDQEEAMTMAGRIAIMNRGKFVQIGEPERFMSTRPPATAPSLSARSTSSKGC